MLTCPFQVNETTLMELFSPFGAIISTRVCRDYITRRSLGYGYVNFQSAADGKQDAPATASLPRFFFFVEFPAHPCAATLTA